MDMFSEGTRLSEEVRDAASIVRHPGTKTLRRLRRLIDVATVRIGRKKMDPREEVRPRRLTRLGRLKRWSSSGSVSGRLLA
jgi:hypothetical protein